MRATIRSPWAASLLLGALTAALIVTPAIASARYQPDGRVRLATTGIVGMTPPSSYTYHGPWLGNNVYNATGAHQTANAVGIGSAMAMGTYYTFDISIQNDGSAVDRLRVKSAGPASAWVVTYSRGTTNITSAVLAGSYRTPLLAPGATYLIHAKVTLKSGSSGSLSVVRLVTIRSVASPTKVDAVKFAFMWNPGVQNGG